MSEQFNQNWRQFVILKTRDQVPIIGGCSQCELKFLPHPSFFVTPMLRKSTFAASSMSTIANDGLRKSANLRALMASSAFSVPPLSPCLQECFVGKGGATRDAIA